jgi:hypothetical protein
MSEHLQKLENGIRIMHEWLGTITPLEVTFDQESRRITVKLGSRKVDLTQEETIYLCAQMAYWYEQNPILPE